MTINLLLKASTLDQLNPYPIQALNERPNEAVYFMGKAFYLLLQHFIILLVFPFAVTGLTFGLLPLLFLSFGFLYVYYKKCHPWVSEGVSVGFEPLDNEIWKPTLAQGKKKMVLSIM